MTNEQFEEAYQQGKNFKFSETYNYDAEFKYLAGKQLIIIDCERGYEPSFNGKIVKVQTIDKSYTGLAIVCCLEVYELNTEDYQTIFRRKRDENLRSIFS